MISDTVGDFVLGLVIMNAVFLPVFFSLGVFGSS